MMKDLGQIAVFMGGPSSEREISLASGEAVLAALKQEGLNARGFDLRSEKDIIDILDKESIDCAFIALHGRFGEDGTLQRILSERGVAYTGSREQASRLAIDKVASREIFQTQGVPCPASLILNKALPSGKQVLSKDADILSISPFDLRKGHLDFIKGFPLVVKPACQGSSIGLSLVEDERHFTQAVELAFTYDERVILEEYLPGDEITVGIFEERPLPIVQICPTNKFFDFQAKYEKGRTEYIVPAPLKEALYNQAQKYALLAHQALDCFCFSRVDMIISRGVSYVLEVNTIPGMTATSLLPKAAKAAGISFSELCLRIIRASIPSYAKNKTKR
jgi:D-alanine-D-alanine ligase